MASRNQATRGEVLRSLSALAPLPPDLEGQLALPESLFELGPCSFSSDPALAASAVGGYFLAHLQLSDRLPDYAIDVSPQGGALFCTFVDKGRKIIAGVRLGNADEPDWDALSIAIRQASRLSASLRASKKRFTYVAAGDDGAERI